MTNPIKPNFTSGTGRLVTDRYDFEGHVIGTSFRHKSDQIDLTSPITINSTVYSDVQSALIAISGALVPPVIPSATVGTATGNLGLVTLGGDFGGTALIPRVTSIRGFPINATPPVLNNVLTWGGSSWGPAAAQAAFTAAGDLTGNAVSQQVVALTGDTTTNPGFHTIVSSADYMQFASTTSPTITQAFTISTPGHNLNISAQSTHAFSGTGGNVNISGGGRFGGPSGFYGGVSVLMGDNHNTFQATQVVGGQRVAAFFTGTGGLTSINMPANTGNDVIFIGDTASTITASPVGGSVLYSKNGQLNVQQSNGVGFPIGSSPNPTVWNANSNSAPGVTLPANGIITFNTTATSVGAVPTTALTFTMNASSSIFLNIKYVGKAVSVLGNSAEYKYAIGFIRAGSGSPAGIGSLTSTDPRFVGTGSTWTVPTVPSVFGNDIIIQTGNHTGETINWTIITEVIVTTA